MGRKRKCENGCKKYYTKSDTVYPDDVIETVWHRCVQLPWCSEEHLSVLWDKCPFRDKNKPKKINKKDLKKAGKISHEEWEENRKFHNRVYNKSVHPSKQIYG